MQALLQRATQHSSAGLMEKSTVKVGCTCIDFVFYMASRYVTTLYHINTFSLT